MLREMSTAGGMGGMGGMGILPMHSAAKRQRTRAGSPCHKSHVCRGTAVDGGKCLSL